MRLLLNMNEMKNSDINKLLEYLSSQINQYYQNILVTNKDVAEGRQPRGTITDSSVKIIDFPYIK